MDAARTATLHKYTGNIVQWIIVNHLSACFLVANCHPCVCCLLVSGRVESRGWFCGLVTWLVVLVLVVTVNSCGRKRGVPYKIYNDLLELLQNGQNVSALRLLGLLLLLGE